MESLGSQDSFQFEQGKDEGFGELKKMMMDLSAKVGAVHADIGLVRSDLGQRTDERNKATLDLTKRMDGS